MTRPSDTEAVTLTDDEREAIRGALGWDESFAVVESIVAARLSASTDRAERAEAQRDGTLAAYREQRDHLNRVMAERDALAAKLEAANTRCAELEAAVEQEIATRDQYADLLDRYAAAIPGDHGEHSSGNDPWTNALASADRLRAAVQPVQETDQ